MPCGRQYGVLTLGTIDGEVVERLVMGIVQTHRHYEVSYLQVGGSRELLVDPELLQLYFATFLLLTFPLGCLVGLVFNGRARARVLKLYLGAQRPALAEVIA